MMNTNNEQVFLNQRQNRQKIGLIAANRDRFNTLRKQLMQNLQDHDNNEYWRTTFCSYHNETS